MTRPAAAVLAETAPLSPTRRKVREDAGGRLDHALPRAVWLDHHYSVLPSERRRPVVVRGTDRWYHFTQVVRRAVNPRAKRRVVVRPSGLMTGVGTKRR